jgi:4-amino-4-deoxy-L-arabinose transferase-like glycosyltransferase
MKEGSNPSYTRVAVALILGMMALLLWRADTIGPTVDEPFHLVRGLAWWLTDSTRLSYAHPPLVNLLQAAPAIWLSPNLDMTSLPGWADGDHIEMATHLFMHQYDSVRPLLFAGRLVNSLLAVLCAVLIYAWISRRMGGAVGLVALVLVAYNPTFLAHAQLLTTDLPVTLAILAVAFGFVEYLAPRDLSAGRKRWGLAVFAVAVAGAMGTKFTTLALVPLLLGIGTTWAVRGWGRFHGLDWRGGLRAVLGDIVIVTALSLLVVAALYRFEEVGLTVTEILNHPEPQCYLTDDFDQDFLEQRSLIAGLPGWFRVPVPYTWLFGLEMVRYHAVDGHSTWFMGFTYSRGNPAYFPILLLIKTPWVALLGFGVAVAAMLRQRRRPDPVEGVMLMLGGWLLAMLTTSNLNIGVRHALPIVPLFSIVAASGLVGLMHQAEARFGGRARVVAWALIFTVPAVTATQAGHYLSWFNIGRMGHAVSMVGEDWGQDGIRLAQTVREHDLTPLSYVPYGAGSVPELRYQGVRVRPTKCRHVPRHQGWVAVHAAVHVRHPDCIPTVSSRPPDRSVADHIYLWQLDPPPRKE